MLGAGSAGAGGRPRPPHSHNILSGLPDRYASILLAKATTVTLRAGAILFRQGDAGDGCYWVQHGALKVAIASQRGQERIIAILGTGSIVGELAMIDDLPRSATISAIVGCELTFVSRKAFTDFLRRHPELNAFLVTTLVARLRQTDEEAAAATFLTVKARVARALLRIADVLGKEVEDEVVAIPEKVRQDDLAAMAGVARENVSRTLSEWRERGVVLSSRDGKLTIDKARLQREAATNAQSVPRPKQLRAAQRS